MALTKQPVVINFGNSINTKTDPYQLPIGQFLALQNSVFDTDGRLTKRNGYPLLTTLPNESQTTLTTLNDNLLATGSNLYAFSSNTNQWVNKGSIQPISLDTLSLVRASTNQVSPDTAVSSTGLVCLVYMDSSVSYYQISDSTTGQQIVPRTALRSTAVNPRVFILGTYFIITYMATVSATPHLQYIAIPIANPSNPGSPADISTTVSSINDGYDAIVANNSLYISWSGSATTVKTTRMSTSLIVSAAVSISSSTATAVSVTADTTASTPIIWITWYDSNTTNGYIAAYNQILSAVLAKTQIITTTTVNEITSAAQNGLCTVFYENANTYTFNSVKSDYVSSLTVDQSGTITGPSVVLRSVGLASKPFIKDSTIYVLVAYGETNQPTYFLIDSSGNIYMRLAYSNGGGYAASQVLPSVSLLDNIYLFPYQIKDFLAPVNKTTNLPSRTPVNGIYTQTGINLAKFSINDLGQYSSNIANVLELTGGQLWEYDGIKPVEHGFHVWPENIYAVGSITAGNMSAQQYYYVFTYEWTDNQGMLHRSAPSIPQSFNLLATQGAFTGTVSNGSPIVTSVSIDTSLLQVGMLISGGGDIQANSYILSIDSPTQFTMTKNALGSSAGYALSATKVTSSTIYVPTLRLTYKVSPNPVRIVGYRWSTAQQVYYQFTSLTSPIINDPTIDYVTITDTNSDAQILGQTLLYTTGGVIENIAPPSFVHTALYKNRLIGIDSEDRNLLWYSKQVIQNTPVEMSDLFTIYVAPTTGSQGSTGDMSAVSAMDDKLIIFKPDAIYYITGNGPDNTGSNNDFSDPIFITSSVGCSNPRSIVLIPNGLMFQSSKGIWLLGRDLSTTYIGAPVEAYNTQIVRSAQVIPNTNQVRFIMNSGLTLMYDYFYNRWGTFSNLSAISATIYDGKHTYLNTFGQIFQESPGTYLDGSSPVLMSFQTGWLNVAGLRGYERFYFMYLLGTYLTPFKLNIQLGYDYDSNTTQSIIVTPDNFSPAWGEEALWGSGTTWGGPSNVFQARIFPQKQKCQTFQITVTELYDPSFGVAAGAGLTLSGVNSVIGVKKGYSPQKASRSFG